MKNAELEHILYCTRRPLVMGVVNVTPDSFSDGGRYFTKGQAVRHALEMIEEGADIIDIGGESSRPGAEPVSEEEELVRVLPVIEEIAAKTTVAISIDTYKSGVARRALNAGAVIVNDISAMRFDSSMAETVKNHDSFIVLMHMLGTPRTMQKNPDYKDVVEDIISFFRERIDFALGKWIHAKRIIIDPGIGFGKNLDHNLELLKELERFVQLGYPVLLGASRKSMIEKITGAPVEERDWGTAALVSHSVLKGVVIHRVHNVKAMRQVCDVAAALRG